MDDASDEPVRAASRLPECGIYGIINLNNGQCYVGSAVNFTKRWKNHRWYLNAGRHANRHLQKSWTKHGAGDFTFSVIELCAADQLIEREQAAINRLRPEYNICQVAGSTLGIRCSDETKQKISAANKGRKMPPRSAAYRAASSLLHKGKPKTPEQMAALQAGRARQVFDEDRRLRVSEAVKRAYAEGRHSTERSPEHRAKIAATLTGRKATPEHRANVRAAMLGKKRGPYKKREANAAHSPSSAVES